MGSLLIHWILSSVWKAMFYLATGVLSVNEIHDFFFTASLRVTFHLQFNPLPSHDRHQCHFVYTWMASQTLSHQESVTIP